MAAGVGLSPFRGRGHPLCDSPLSHPVESLLAPAPSVELDRVGLHYYGSSMRDHAYVYHGSMLQTRRAAHRVAESGIPNLAVIFVDRVLDVWGAEERPNDGTELLRGGRICGTDYRVRKGTTRWEDLWD